MGSVMVLQGQQLRNYSEYTLKAECSLQQKSFPLLSSTFTSRCLFMEVTLDEGNSAANICSKLH